MAKPTVKTRLLLISDTHNTLPFPTTDPTHPFRHPLPPADILIHAGDLTETGSRHEHDLTLSWLRSHPAPLKIVIPGNHDVTFDKPYYATHQDWHHSGPEDPEEILGLYTGPEARAAGIEFMVEGTRGFELGNGARLTVYASGYTPEFCDWAFAYPREEDRFNGPAKNPVPDYPGVDVMVTHGPPRGILDRVPGFGKGMSGSVGCDHLWRAAARARPMVHVFGHIHEGWGGVRMEWGLGKGEDAMREVTVEKEEVLQRRGQFMDLSSTGKEPLKGGRETLFVNASLMNVRYKPLNAVWIVDLDLSCS